LVLGWVPAVYNLYALVEVAAVAVLHHQADVVVKLDVLVERHHVRVLELLQDSDLGL